MLNLLFIADAVGSPGREAVKRLLPDLRRRHDVSLVICNAENSAAGFGCTRESAAELFKAGVDVLTGGNHIWDRRESIPYLAEEKRLVRPANLPPGTPGQGWGVFTAADGTPVGVMNLLGRVYMKEADSPFRAADLGIAALRERCKVIVVDFHAETTAEKIALGWHVDGRVSAVFGTHTHVATADERVLPGGTAFICDAGMTGGFDSVIGMEREGALRRFLTLMPERLIPAERDLRINAVLVSIDPTTGRAASIRRLDVPIAEAAREGGAKVLRGDACAEQWIARTRGEVDRLRSAGVVPGLALVTVGDDAASKIYLRKKAEAAAKVGIEVRQVALPAGSDTRSVVERVTALGTDPDVHGILVQLPLAPPAEARAVLEAIPPIKDVDGFHPMNVGRLAQGLPALAPATPRGVVELLRFHGIPLAGRHAVVLGRSNIVGRPLATMLSQKDCNMTVTIGHSMSGTKLPEIAREADLLVAAIGRAEMITDAWVKPGATVVDVGIHRVPLEAPDSNGKTSRLTGDVHAPSVSRVAGALTPVPGGVGPMTVAMVIANTAWAAAEQTAGHVQAH
jgi:metallophosphoesterase (TIGR00282 family)